MKVYSYRYLWQCEGSDKVNFKIVTDVLEGLLEFEKNLLLVPGLIRAAKEYLHEYDCALVGKFESIYGGDKNEA